MVDIRRLYGEFVNKKRNEDRFMLFALLIIRRLSVLNTAPYPVLPGNASSIPAAFKFYQQKLVVNRYNMYQSYVHVVWLMLPLH